MSLFFLHNLPIILSIAAIIIVGLLVFSFSKGDQLSSFLDQAYKIMAIVFFISASFFLISFSIDRYFGVSSNQNNTASSIANSNSQYPINKKHRESIRESDNRSESVQSNQISNETLLAVLSLLIAFASLLAYIFKRLIQIDLKQENQFLINDSKMIAGAETDISSALSLLYAHKYINCSNLCGSDSLGRDKLDSGLVKTSAQLSRKAMEGLSGVHDKDAYKPTFIKCQNNLAVALAFFFNPSDSDIEDARNISCSLYSKRKEQSLWPDYAFEATRALVLLRYHKSTLEKDFALGIYKTLLEERHDIPDSAISQIIENKKYIEDILDYNEKSKKDH